MRLLCMGFKPCVCKLKFKNIRFSRMVELKFVDFILFFFSVELNWMNIPVPLLVVRSDLDCHIHKLVWIWLRGRCIESDRTRCYTGKFNMALDQSVWSSRGSLSIFMRVSWCLQLQECGNSCLSTLCKWTSFFNVNNLLHRVQWQSVPTEGIMYGVSIP